MGWNSLELTHRFLARHVRPGAFCIDATVGKGRDAVFLAELAGPEGRVLGLDIQEEALAAARALVRERGLEERVELRLLDHRELDRCAPPASADCVVFNLGWLPGGDHRVFTRAESTLPALEKALALLKPGGVLSLCIYYGKENGYGERDAVLAWLRGLDPRVWNVLVLTFPNRGNDPPIPVFLLKEG